MIKSAIYTGTITHCRVREKSHIFHYKAYFFYLDWEEVATKKLNNFLFSNRFSPIFWCNRKDYHHPEEKDLASAVRNTVKEQLGVCPEGSIRILTQIRCLGFVFNPVTFYYVFDENEQIFAILAEVENTPWKQRYSYVLGPFLNNDDTTLKQHNNKNFHVSPFMPMNQQYSWIFSLPEENLHVQIANSEQQQHVFCASLNLKKNTFTWSKLVFIFFRYPLMPLFTLFGIYVQALKLWRKGITFFKHPHSDACFGQKKVETKQND